MRRVVRTLLVVLGLAATWTGRPLQAEGQEKIGPAITNPHAPHAHAIVAGGDCCPDSCKKCIPVPAKKTVTKIVYSSRCIDFCLPKCPRLSLDFGKKCGHGCAGDCGRADCADCVRCERPRTRAVLIKRAVVSEEHTIKCEVVQQPRPICPPACPPAPCAAGTPAPAGARAVIHAPTTSAGLLGPPLQTAPPQR